MTGLRHSFFTTSFGSSYLAVDLVGMRGGEAAAAGVMTTAIVTVSRTVSTRVRPARARVESV